MIRKTIAVVGLPGLVATCSRDSSTLPPAGPTAAEPTLSSLTINGPNQVQPGESQQFSATATFSDRTTRDVTTAAVWRTSNGAVFSVTAGLVVALTTGEGVLLISYQNRGASLNVVSLPAGTGILFGHVTESSFSIGGATIEVVGGPFNGRSVVSDASGLYRLYGVVGDLQIRASHIGYSAVTQQVTVAPLASPRRDQVLNFDLSFSTPPSALAGSYRAVLRASGTCGSRLPADTTVRNYVATLTQDGSRLTIVLSGGEFAVDPRGVQANQFSGRARPDSVELAMGSFDFYYGYYYAASWAFVEHLIRPPVGQWGVSQTDYLAVAGTAVGAITSSTISTTLNGMVAVYQATGSFYAQNRLLSSCTAKDHQFVLTRQ